MSEESQELQAGADGVVEVGSSQEKVPEAVSTPKRKHQATLGRCFGWSEHRSPKSEEVLEEEDEVAPVGFEEGDFPAEGEEDFPVVVVGDGAGVEDVVGDFKTEADIRRRVKIGDVEHVASKTLQTG